MISILGPVSAILGSSMVLGSTALSSGMSPSASGWPLYLCHGVLRTHSTLCLDHRSSGTNLLTDLALNTPCKVAIHNSPLLARAPTKMPYCHRAFTLFILA